MEVLIFAYKFSFLIIALVLIIYGIIFFRKGFNVNTGEVVGGFEKVRFKIQKLSPGLLCITVGGIITVCTIQKGIDARTTSKVQTKIPKVDYPDTMKSIDYLSYKVNVDSLYKISLIELKSGRYLNALELLNIVKGYYLNKNTNSNNGLEIDENIRLARGKIIKSISENEVLDIKEESKSYKVNDEKFDTLK